MRANKKTQPYIHLENITVLLPSRDNEVIDLSTNIEIEVFFFNYRMDIDNEQH